ncbi:PaaI family thioesterase [Thermobifida alba]|uniref:Acyl-coenzyme A thioesterase THEM4 n=1 Tax=Thermobifida alba TaxID=53522 RepID=A0ABY4KX08_THEAE|nr:PaaI family thioesterase [Thermobifida alba]UPT19978.1 PaaI family thioesterase [Thermobifida alba]HLU96326.1 PaaI family thioesterase [Thermobifida alba]
MTVDAHPIAELPNPADYGFTVVDPHELPAELLTLVDRVRELVDAVAHTDADPAELAAASRTVDELTERLGARRRPVGAMVRQTWEGGRVDYNTLANVVSGPANPVAPLRNLRATDDGLYGEVTLDSFYEGPPGFVHGGWVAALLDQVLGEATAVFGRVCMTGNLTVDYRRPTPLNTPLTVSSRITGVERRKVFVSGEIRCDGKVTAEGSAIMVQLEAPPA